ncbi:hypothetical protein [Chryseobacterium sp. CH21]|nr:hypothetical protein [Chryseobacterium sp. CH21]
MKLANLKYYYSLIKALRNSKISSLFNPSKEIVRFVLGIQSG